MTPKPNPALVTRDAAKRLPRFALLLFCAAYVLPGLFGRDGERVVTDPGVETRTFKCAACGETFEYGWSDEDAKEELATNNANDAFGAGRAVGASECDLVCDDCYKSMGL